MTDTNEGAAIDSILTYNLKDSGKDVIRPWTDTSSSETPCTVILGGTSYQVT